MLNPTIIEWIGYIASAIVAISLLMNSILKLRWYNLIGSSCFSLYGFLIGSLPVALLNLFIALINIFYLTKKYSQKEYFKILEVRSENKYLIYFLEHHINEIHRYFPNFKYNPEKNTLSFFVLRNLAVAGVFLAHKYDETTLFVDLDFVISEYRDYKLGKYILVENEQYFSNIGITRICSLTRSKNHDKYLGKMGFKQETIDGKSVMVKYIN